MKENNKKLLWIALFVLLVIITIYIIIKQNDTFTFKEFIAFIKNSSLKWVLLAFAGMFGFVLFEGLAIRVLCHAFGYKIRFTRSIGYASSDICFSAITPSATGGQPAAAYLMMKDKIPGATTTIILLVNLTLYTISIIIIGVICFLTKPELLIHFTPFSKILIFIGFLFQFVLISIFILLVYKEKIVIKIASGGIKVLTKLHLMRNGVKKQEHLIQVEKQYKECAAAIKNHKKALLTALIFNILQRVSQLMISVCVFMATGGILSKMWDIFITQGYVVLGSHSVPIPGSVGVADYLFFDGFDLFINDPTNLELFSRGISFYCCIIICAIINLAIYINEGVKGIKQKKNDRVL